MAAVKTYTVRVVRWDRGWELHVPGVGVTQSHGLMDARQMVVDYIRMMTGDEPRTDAVNLEIEIGDDLDEIVQLARRHVIEAAEAQRVAAEESRQVARQLRDRGFTGRDIAAVLGVSPQRVSQLTTG